MSDDTTDPTPETPQVAQEDLLGRVIYAFLRPAVRLAIAGGVSMRDITDWLRLAHLREARRRGLKMREIAGLAGVSIATLARLSKRLKDDFVRPEREHELPTRIEFMLWAEPLSAGRIHQALPGFEAKKIDAALELLVDEGRARLVPGRVPKYEIVLYAARRADGDVFAKIDALDSLLESTIDAVAGRFFAQDPRALARTAMLRVADEDLPELRKLYEEVVWPALVKLDKRAEGKTDTNEMQVSLLWAPLDLIHVTPVGPPTDTPSSPDTSEND